MPLPSPRSSHSTPLHQGHSSPSHHPISGGACLIPLHVFLRDFCVCCTRRPRRPQGRRKQHALGGPGGRGGSQLPSTMREKRRRTTYLADTLHVLYSVNKRSLSAQVDMHLEVPEQKLHAVRSDALEVPRRMLPAQGQVLHRYVCWVDTAW